MSEIAPKNSLLEATTNTKIYVFDYKFYNIGSTLYYSVKYHTYIEDLSNFHTFKEVEVTFSVKCFVFYCISSCL